MLTHEDALDINEKGDVGYDVTAQDAPPENSVQRGKATAAAQVKTFFVYLAFWTFFALVFAVMLALLTAALVGIPAGLMLGVFGIAMTVFKADFIITEISGQMMLFGGFCCAFASAFVGLLAVKAGFMTGRLFLRTKRLCDRLRGW